MKEDKWDEFWNKAEKFIRVPVGTILIYVAILEAIEIGGVLVPTIECLLWTFAPFYVGTGLLIREIQMRIIYSKE